MIDDEVEPGEYDHTYENVNEEEIRDHGGSLRVAVWIISALIAAVMVALPVLRVVDWGGDDDDDPGASASEARQFVATRFAAAALGERAASDAARWAVPNLRAEIDTIVSDLRQRSAADLSGATVSIARVDCDGSAGADRECFQAWIRQPGAADLLRVQFVVGIVNGDARVIEIERVNVVCVVSRQGQDVCSVARPASW